MATKICVDAGNRKEFLTRGTKKSCRLMTCNVAREIARLTRGEKYIGECGNFEVAGRQSIGLSYERDYFLVCSTCFSINSLKLSIRLVVGLPFWNLKPACVKLFLFEDLVDQPVEITPDMTLPGSQMGLIVLQFLQSPVLLKFGRGIISDFVQSLGHFPQVHIF